jgi:hypothetical protein
VKLGEVPVRFAVGGQSMPILHPEQLGPKWNIQFVVAPVIPKLVKDDLADPKSIRFGLDR